MFFENKDNTRVSWRFFFAFEVMQKPSHSEMQPQPRTTVSAYKEMLSMTATRFETTPFQLTCELAPGKVFEQICAPYIDIDDTLMQRCGVEISFERLDIRQLGHRLI